MAGIRIAKEDKVKQPDGTWKQRIEVCNDSLSDKEVSVRSYPYTDFVVKVTEGDKWEPPGTRPDPPGPDEKPQPGTQGRIITKGKCETFVFEWKEEPKRTYTDVFAKDSAGDWKTEDATIGNPLSANNIPQTNPPYAFVFANTPIPYPFVVEGIFDQPLEFTIKDVRLPPGWKIAFANPSVGKPFTLRPGQKEFGFRTLISVTDPPIPTPQPPRRIPMVSVEVTWAIEPHPGIQGILPFERTYRTVFVVDSEPPVLRVAVRKRGATTKVTVTGKDPGGIHELPTLTIERSLYGKIRTRSYVVPVRTLLAGDEESAIGITAARYEIELPTADIRNCAISVTLSDQFGNLAVVRRKLL